MLRSEKENYLITGIDPSGRAREIYKNGNLARRVEIFLPEVGYIDVVAARFSTFERCVRSRVQFIRRPRYRESITLDGGMANS